MANRKETFKLFELEEVEEPSPVVETDKESDPNLASELPKVKEPAKVEVTTRQGKVIAGKDLNVRAAASPDSSVIGQVKPRSMVTIVATEVGWYKIAYGETFGYVMEQYIK